MKAYKGYVTATRGDRLLGGVRHLESTPFETSDMAQTWVSAIVLGNSEAQRPLSAWGWFACESSNPIMESEITP